MSAVDTFTRDKGFGLANIGQRWLEGNTIAGREGRSFEY
jgi:hypothetical protein